MFSSTARNLYNFSFRLVSLGNYTRSILTGVVLCSAVTTIIWLRNNASFDLAILTAALIMLLRTMPLALGLTRLRQGYFSRVAFLDNFEFYFNSLKSKQEDMSTGSSLDTLHSGIEIQSLIFQYDKTSSPQLNVNRLQIEKGQMLALVGRSGSGKTTSWTSSLGFYTNLQEK